MYNIKLNIIFITFMNITRTMRFFLSRNIQIKLCFCGCVEEIVKKIKIELL